MEGPGGTNGNYFEGEIQPNTGDDNALRAVYCEGDSNTFDIFIWDWASLTSNTAVELTATTRKN